jgi:hypothetical protein
MNSLVVHRIVAIGIAVLVLGASSALAQSPYVSASVGMDVSRFSGADVDGRGYVR